MEKKILKRVIESALFAAGEPLDVKRLIALFPEKEAPGKGDVRDAVKALQAQYEDTALELREVASGFRFQIRMNYAPWIKELWTERPPRYSRASVETLAIIAYKQPVTRPEIEAIRGVAVSTQIIQNLEARGWIHDVGTRDAPGRPTLYATTKTFLDHFNLKRLSDLPPLDDATDLEEVARQLQIPLSELDPTTKAVNAEGVPIPAVIDEESEQASEPRETFDIDTSFDEVLAALDDMNQKADSVRQQTLGQDEPDNEEVIETDITTTVSNTDTEAFIEESETVVKKGDILPE